MYGIIDMSGIAIRQSQTGCRPIGHDSVTDDLCPNLYRIEVLTQIELIKSICMLPECPDDCTNKNRILLDV